MGARVGRSPFLFQRVLQHLDSSHQVCLQILLPFSFSLEEGHLSLRGWGTEGKEDIGAQGSGTLKGSVRPSGTAPVPTHHDARVGQSLKQCAGCLQGPSHLPQKELKAFLSLRLKQGQQGPPMAAGLWGEARSEAAGGTLPALDSPPHPDQLLSLGGGEVAATIASEHLPWGDVGSYFWSLGTSVGGWAQRPLQCRSLTTQPYLWGPVSTSVCPGLRKRYHRHSPGSCLALHTVCWLGLLQPAPVCQQVIWRHWANSL